jgi:hypothetical protein
LVVSAGFVHTPSLTSRQRIFKISPVRAALKAKNARAFAARRSIVMTSARKAGASCHGTAAIGRTGRMSRGAPKPADRMCTHRAGFAPFR